MPQSPSNLLVHLFRTTKNRDPWLETSVRDRFDAFLAETTHQLDSEAYRVGGVADHVHLTVQLSRALAVSDLTFHAQTMYERKCIV